jgi:hypothetical protein
MAIISIMAIVLFHGGGAGGLCALCVHCLKEDGCYFSQCNWVNVHSVHPKTETQISVIYDTFLFPPQLKKKLPLTTLVHDDTDSFLKTKH